MKAHPSRLLLVGLLLLVMVLSFALLATGTAAANPIQENIIYLNYDGTPISNLDPSMPLTYTVGQQLTLPTIPPSNDMPGYIFLGFYDSPLDQLNTVPMPPPWEDFQTINLAVGNKITMISASQTGTVTLYARYTSDFFTETFQYYEATIIGVPGVFPNTAQSAVRVIAPADPEYDALVASLNLPVNAVVKIILCEVVDDNGNRLQPNTFFGNAFIAFAIPEDFNEETTQLFKLLPDGPSQLMDSKPWLDADGTGLWFIDTWTDTLGLFAIVSTIEETTVDPGLPNTGDAVVGSLVSALAPLAMALPTLYVVRRRRLS